MRREGDDNNQLVNTSVSQERKERRMGGGRERGRGGGRERGRGRGRERGRGGERERWRGGGRSCRPFLCALACTILVPSQLTQELMMRIS